MCSTAAAKTPDDQGPDSGTTIGHVLCTVGFTHRDLPAVIATALTKPQTLGLPFTSWMLDRPAGQIDPFEWTRLATSSFVSSQEVVRPFSNGPSDERSCIRNSQAEAA